MTNTCTKAALGLTALLAGPAAMAEGIHYTLDGHASDVTARVAFLGFATKTARFPQVSGALVVDPADFSRAEVTVDIDARTLTTGDGTTGLLRGPAFFDVRRYPTLHFVGRNLRMTGPRSATVNGTMTAHGVTRPLTLTLQFSAPPIDTGGTEPLDVTGSTVVDRYDFGMSSFPLVVGHKVTVVIRARMEPG